MHGFKTVEGFEILQGCTNICTDTITSQGKEEMTIQFNTDKNIEGNEKMEAFINTSITDELTRFKDGITRIEVHLSDENGSKTGQHDKRCMLEARLENRQPIAVTKHAETIERALFEAIEKLKALMETYNKLGPRR
jgi:hypothetical protein